MEDVPAVQIKPKQGPHPVETLFPGRTRVQVESTPTRVFLDDEQMGMATDKQVGPVLIQAASNAFGIAPGPAPDVGHPNATTAPF